MESFRHWCADRFISPRCLFSITPTVLIFALLVFVSPFAIVFPFVLAEHETAVQITATYLAIMTVVVAVGAVAWWRLSSAARTQPFDVRGFGRTLDVSWGRTTIAIEFSDSAAPVELVRKLAANATASVVVEKVEEADGLLWVELRSERWSKTSLHRRWLAHWFMAARGTFFAPLHAQYPLKSVQFRAS